jgi:hypothetical protein
MKTNLGSGHPKITEMQANSSGLDHAIQQEISRIAERECVDNDYQVANQTWEDAQDNYNQQKVQADLLNDKAIRYIKSSKSAAATHPPSIGRGARCHLPKLPKLNRRPSAPR